ncbi:hypothetical protein ELY33_10615 [Vreelandella andesensis]|uniref:Uncharacterized protein n=1 Tax=Vreelandella andesensis TaxID=447567 RepID=A0A3S0W327_9GAMM|nr:hypothetical protein [Halomonas andesensis]RUR30257.1 hypothetical protein ELY33_10615 [Halomonas andesensis]
MKKRSDGKKTNARKDAKLVSTVKTLVESGLPPRMIALVFDIRESTISQYRTNDRQADVVPLSLAEARKNLIEHIDAAFESQLDSHVGDQAA